MVAIDFDCTNHSLDDDKESKSTSSTKSLNKVSSSCDCNIYGAVSQWQQQQQGNNGKSCHKGFELWWLLSMTNQDELRPIFLIFYFSK